MRRSRGGEGAPAGCLPLRGERRGGRPWLGAVSLPARGAATSPFRPAAGAAAMALVLALLRRVLEYFGWPPDQVRPGAGAVSCRAAPGDLLVWGVLSAAVAVTGRKGRHRGAAAGLR